MPSIQYGDRVINYEIIEAPNLKSHYITVEKDKGVILKGRKVSIPEANKLVAKKARWIIKKLEVVESFNQSDIVTGSRIQYLGRRYYTQVIQDNNIKKSTVHFNESKFIISIPANTANIQLEIQGALDMFFRQRAKEKITPRVSKWSKLCGLNYNQLKFQKLEKRWGSCTNTDNILINYLAIKLPFSLIDYLIIHELCHTVEKNHSKRFYTILSKHLPNWKRLDEKILGMKL
ncbi:hypothetical protein DSECCO2_164920 [anaerobic digester metagenome]